MITARQRFGWEALILNLENILAGRRITDGAPRTFRESFELGTGLSSTELFKASLATTDWAYAFATAVNRQLVLAYGTMGLDIWRAFVRVVRLENFKEHQCIRFGGYGNFPIISEGNPYPPMASPGDEKAAYTPAARGGTEDVTRCMIINDDIGAVAAIIQRLARSAAETLYDFIFDLINPATNPVIYDGQVLYMTNAGGITRNNYGTAALDATTLGNARLRMRKQTEKNSNKRLNLRGRYLLVPGELEGAANSLRTASFEKTPDVPDYLQDVGIVPVVVGSFTDINNWVLVADMRDAVGIELGFINGRQDPEVFISNDEKSGSMFTNEKIILKLRFEFGACVSDARALDGSIVGG